MGRVGADVQMVVHDASTFKCVMHICGAERGEAKWGTTRVQMQHMGM